MNTRLHLTTRIAPALVVLALMLAGPSQAAMMGKMSAKHAHPAVKITAAQANRVALEKYPGKIVDKTKLENEEGKWQYGVMVKSGKILREVMVDAKTGKIASVEVTTGHKERVEAKSEMAPKGATHKVYK